MISEIGSFVGVLGSLSSALAVLYAIRTYNRHEREKLLDSIKVDAVIIKSSFKELDRLVSFEFFLEVADRYAERIDRISGANGDVEKLKLFLLNENSHVALHRELSLSVAEASGVERSKKIVGDINRQLVSVSQDFPLSASIIGSCIIITNNIVNKLTSTDTFSQFLTMREIEENIDDSHKRHQSYRHFLSIFSSIISDPATRFLGSSGQKVIDQCEIIIDVICDNLTKKPYVDLVRMRSNELSSITLSKKESIIDNIGDWFEANRKFFTESEKDRIVSAIAVLRSMG